MYNVGLENNSEGRSQAWVLGHPGCFTYGADGSHALLAVPKAIQDYRHWINQHTSESWLTGGDAERSEYRLEETWECYSINSNYELVQDGYEVNAWFRHDWIPLSAEDIRHGLLLLSWGRAELLEVVSDLSAEILERTYPKERWSISGILKHIGGAEWWYLERLGLAFPRADVPEDPFRRLEKVRSSLVEILPGLVGSTMVVGIDGEFWSPRKLLRRAVWHEYDHIAHIRKLL
jgi:DinB superfamily